MLSLMFLFISPWALSERQEWKHVNQLEDSSECSRKPAVATVKVAATEIKKHGEIWYIFWKCSWLDFCIDLIGRWSCREKVRNQGIILTFGLKLFLRHLKAQILELHKVTCEVISSFSSALKCTKFCWMNK